MPAPEVDGPCSLIDLLGRVAVTSKNTMCDEGFFSADATAEVIGVTARESYRSPILSHALKSLPSVSRSFTCRYEIGVST